VPPIPTGMGAPASGRFQLVHGLIQVALTGLQPWGRPDSRRRPNVDQRNRIRGSYPLLRKP